MIGNGLTFSTDCWSNELRNSNRTSTYDDHPLRCLEPNGTANGWPFRRIEVSILKLVAKVLWFFGYPLQSANEFKIVGAVWCSVLLPIVGSGAITHFLYGRCASIDRILGTARVIIHCSTRRLVQILAAFVGNSGAGFTYAIYHAIWIAIDPRANFESLIPRNRTSTVRFRSFPEPANLEAFQNDYYAQQIENLGTANRCSRWSTQAIRYNALPRCGPWIEKNNGNAFRLTSFWRHILS